MRLHHSGVVVRNMDQACAHYEAVMGLVVTEGPVYDPAQDATLLMMRPPGGGPGVELIAPASKDSKVAGQAARGGGLVHTCYEVDDLDAELLRLRDAGAMPVMEATPALLFGGKRVAFLMLRTRHLIELVEA